MYKRVHCTITYLRCSSRGPFFFFFIQKRETDIRACDRCTYAMVTVLWTRADVIRRQTFQGSPRLSRKVSLPRFSLLSLLFLLSSFIRTGCSIEFTVANTVGFLNSKDVSLSLSLTQYVIFSITSIYNELNILKKKQRFY